MTTTKRTAHSIKYVIESTRTGMVVAGFDRTTRCVKFSFKPGEVQFFHTKAGGEAFIERYGNQGYGLNAEEVQVTPYKVRKNAAPQRTTISSDAMQVAVETENAYSYNRYGEKNWERLAQFLFDRGYEAAEVVAILRSKWTRWAADAAEKEYTNTTVADFKSWLEKTYGATKDGTPTLAEARAVIRMTEY